MRRRTMAPKPQVIRLCESTPNPAVDPTPLNMKKKQYQKGCWKRWTYVLLWEPISNKKWGQNNLFHIFGAIFAKIYCC